MKGTLVKREDRYDLYNESDGYKIASTAPNPQSRLSIINCESIEKGYSIEEIDALFKKVPHTVQNEEDYWKCRAGFITGFQTAMEILGDKKFSEEDMRNAMDMITHIENWDGERGFGQKYTEDEIIQSLQQTEWDVEIIEVRQRCHLSIGDWVSEDENGEFPMSINGAFGYRYIPKLDADGCLVLKRI